MELLVALGLIAFKVALLIAILLLLPLPLTWLERKIAGHMQQRISVGEHTVAQVIVFGAGKVTTRTEHFVEATRRFERGATKSDVGANS